MPATMMTPMRRAMVSVVAGRTAEPYCFALSETDDVGMSELPA